MWPWWLPLLALAEHQEVDEGFDFSRVSYAQQVVGDDFEDDFLEGPGEMLETEGCCMHTDTAAMKACANRSAPITSGADPPKVLVVSHAPKDLWFAAATAVMNSMWCAEQGYPFVLDERESAWRTSRVEVIPHWLQRCREEGIPWLLWLDSDAFLLGQDVGFDPLAQVLEKYPSSDTQIMLTSEMDEFMDSTKIPWDKGNLGVMLLRCSEWTMNLLEQVRQQCASGAAKGDEDTMEKRILEEGYEVSGEVLYLPPQSLNSMVQNQVYGPNASAQPVVHLPRLPFTIRNTTISAALRAHCERNPGSAVNFTAIAQGFNSGSFEVANKDFREAGTSRFAFHLARRLREEGRDAETEELLRWAVDGLRTELGEQKLDTLIGKVVLAKFLGKMNRPAEANVLLETVVHTAMKLLGVHNPVMIEWQEVYGEFLKDEGRYDEAAGWLRHAVRGLRRWKEEAKVRQMSMKLRYVLERNGTPVPSLDGLIDETVLHLPDASDSRARKKLVTANEKSSKFIGASNLDEAEHILIRALEKAILVLPVTDPDVLVTRLNLGALRQRAGRVDEAMMDFEDVFQLQAVALGEDHRDTIATSKAILGLEKLSGKKDLHLKYQAAMEKLGAANQRFVARTKRSHRLQDKSVTEFTAAIQKAERRLGKAAPAVLKAKFNLAVILALQDRSGEAFPMWRKVVEDQLRYLGPFHQDTVTSLRGMVSWIYQEAN